MGSIWLSHMVMLVIMMAILVTIDQLCMAVIILMAAGHNFMDISVVIYTLIIHVCPADNRFVLGQRDTAS